MFRGFLLGITLFVSVLWLPNYIESAPPPDICPKHNISTGEYTTCYYCHKAETQEEPGFTIDTSSTFCLECHDGSTLGASSFSPTESIAQRISRPTAVGHIRGVDHPFSVNYSEAKNLSPTLKLRSNPISPVRLFEGKVECASCHDPHSCSNPIFLRIKNDRSNLCMACHNM